MKRVKRKVSRPKCPRRRKTVASVRMAETAIGALTP